MIRQERVHSDKEVKARFSQRTQFQSGSEFLQKKKSVQIKGDVGTFISMCRKSKVIFTCF